MKKTLKISISLLVLCFIILLGYFGLRHKILIKNYESGGVRPNQNIVFTEFNQYKQGKSYQINNEKDKAAILNLFGTSKKTKIDSVADIPSKESFILVQFYTIGSESEGRLSLYEENGREFLDQPYDKLYEFPKGSLQEIKKNYRNKGRVIDNEIRWKSL